MRKAINFDIDTKKYEEYTGQSAPASYVEIKNYLKKIRKIYQSLLKLKKL